MKVEIPDWVGVPERVPEEERERPEGSLPDIIDHVYGDVPPVASNVYEYGWFCVPSGRGDVEVMVREEVVVKFRVNIIFPPAESVCVDEGVIEDRIAF